MEKTENKGILVKACNWFKNLTVKGLLKTILVVFIIILIVMSASYLPNIISRVSSSLSAALYSVFVPAEGASMTADKKIVNSGEDFNINFKKGDNATDGLFTISYGCSANANLFSVENSGLKKIACDTPYYLLDNGTTIKIRPSTDDSVVRLVITGAFENNTTQKIETVGVARITVTNSAANVVADVPNKTATTTNNSNVTGNTNTNNYASSLLPTYYGKADLAVRILQVGLMTNGTNLITNQNQFSYSDMVGIRFEIRNDGDTNTGPWSFTATLPSISTPTYNSNTQISLKPGESIIFTLGFSNLSGQYNGVITINADPLNLISESNKINNTASQTITNVNYNNNYNYNYNNNYNNGCYINGFFTYNCNNNWNYDYNYHYYNDYNNGALGVTCSVSPNNPSTGDRVRWSADAFGGDGDYNYSWTGTNGLNSSSQNPSKTYNSTGLKTAVVTVESDGYYASRTCSVYVD